MTQKAFFLIRPSGRRLIQGLFPGTRRQLICDDETPTIKLVTGIVELIEPGCIIPLHYHHIEEFQYVLSGNGLARDGQGNEYPVSVGTSVYCRPGVQGAHEFENNGREPLEILFVFPSEGGKFPDVEVVDRRGEEK